MLLTTWLSLLLPIVFFGVPAAQGTAPDAVYAPLWLYNGSWHVTKKDQPAGAKPDELLNQCALIGKYLSCQQTVNGAVSALLIFLPAKSAAQYYTQSVMPDGRAGGRGDLTISGDKWTYFSSWNQGGKSIYYRTINTFMGKNRIHFEQQESSDNKEWKTTSSGDEVRISAGRMTVAH